MFRIFRTICILTGLTIVSACSTLHDAVKQGDIKEAQQMIASGSNVNEQDQHGFTPLYWAANGCNESMVNLLLEKGAPLDAKTRWGSTPLEAAIHNTQNYSQLSYRYPQFKDTYSTTSQNCFKISSLFIDRGANINTPDSASDTPLGRAIWTGYLNTAKFLIDKGANVNSANNRGFTPLLLLVSHQFPRNKEQISNPYTPGYAPRDQVEELEIAKLLLEKGADINAVDIEGKSNALIFAAANEKIQIARLLIDRGMNVNSKNSSSGTPLIFAAKSGNTELLKLLLGKGADINAISQSGNTALTWAAAGGHTEAVKILLARGAHLNTRNKDGKSALDLAKENSKSDAYVLLSTASQMQTAQLSQQLNAELQKILGKNDQTALKKFLDQHPEALSSIKDSNLRLLYTGPNELRIIDVEEMSRNKIRDALVIAQINSVGGPYKKFSASEMTTLKKHGLSDEVVAALLTVTTEYQKEQKRQAEQQAMMAINKTAQAPSQQKAVQAQAAQPQQVAEASTPAGCVKLVAAIKACDQTGGFMAMGCKALAKSQFDCPVPVETLMR